MKHEPPFAPATDAGDSAATLRCDPAATAGSALSVTEEDEAPPLDYDPAEYRWVPVRRRPRLDGWTEEKQRRFIETLADTGLVNLAARAVGMSRESAYQLRRSAHGAAFARAWDAARHHAGGLIEDIAFERAIEGTEQEVLNRDGEVVATRLVHDNRLLQFLLGHLRPDRYRVAHAPAAAACRAGVAPALDETLRAMEPALPAPADRMLDPESLADALTLAEAADGVLPRFLSEQRGAALAPGDARAAAAAEAAAARDARGAAALARAFAGAPRTRAEDQDLCFHLDPVGNRHPPPRRRRGTDPVSGDAGPASPGGEGRG